MYLQVIRINIIIIIIKVALLPEWKILISFKIRYVIALSLQILELKKSFESNIPLPRY